MRQEVQGKETLPPGGRPRSEIDHALEAAEDHALAVERHVLVPGDAGVLHHLRVDLVAVFARLVHDPRKEHGLARLQIHTLWERCELTGLHVVGLALVKLERPVLFPDLSGLAGHLTVGGDVGFRDRYDESIDIGHDSLLSLTPGTPRVRSPCTPRAALSRHPQTLAGG